VGSSCQGSSPIEGAAKYSPNWRWCQGRKLRCRDKGAPPQITEERTRSESRAEHSPRKPLPPATAASSVIFPWNCCFQPSLCLGSAGFAQFEDAMRSTSTDSARRSMKHAKKLALQPKVNSSSKRPPIGRGRSYGNHGHRRIVTYPDQIRGKEGADLACTRLFAQLNTDTHTGFMILDTDTDFPPSRRYPPHRQGWSHGGNRRCRSPPGRYGTG